MVRLLSFLIVLSVLSVLSANGQAKADLSFDEFVVRLEKASNAQILDVRSPEEFGENHLKGAISFHVPDDAAFANQLTKLDKSRPVFVYSINNGRSTVVSKKLADAGFKEVYPLPGGLAHWIGAGKPIESKPTSGLTVEAYNKTIAEAGIIIVDIGSKHCGGCRKLEPVVEEVSQQQGVKLFKVELYNNRELAKQLEIQSIPTLIIYKGKNEIWRKSGAITKFDIEDALEKSL